MRGPEAVGVLMMWGEGGGVGILRLWGVLMMCQLVFEPLTPLVTVKSA